MRLSTWLLTAALAVGLFAPALAKPATSIMPLRTIKPVVIKSSNGGVIDTFVDWYTSLKDSGVPVEVDGVCISACTLVLMLPKEQVCVRPGTVFGFHMAWSGSAYAPNPEPVITQHMIEKYYPPAVQKWLEGKVLTVAQIEYMPYKEIVNLGVLDACK
jgi:hypothetical protein